MTHRLAQLTRIVNADSVAMGRLADAGVEIAIDLAGYRQLMDSEEGRARWREILAEVDGLVVGLQEVDDELLAGAPALRYVLRLGTGLDNVDVDAARSRGVEVHALAGMNAGSVAEFAFALLLAAAKRLPEVDAEVRAGGWGRTVGRQLEGSTLGLIGFGPIARAMVAKAHGFGMDVLVHRRTPDPATDREYGVRSVGLDELLSTSPFISLHAPLTPETERLIGPREIGLLRGAVLVNTARGGLIDEQALLDGLAAGNVAAAALDVLVEEPPQDSALIGHPHVLVTSHTAGQTDAVNAAIAAAAADFIIARIESKEAR